MKEVAPDSLPTPLVTQIEQRRIQVAYHITQADRYVLEVVLPTGQRQELEYDCALARCLTVEERRAELPPPRSEMLADERFLMMTSYSIDESTLEKRVTFAASSVIVVRSVYVPLVWDGGQLIRDAMRRQQWPDRYAALSREERIEHWAMVLHRWRRAQGESGRDETRSIRPMWSAIWNVPSPSCATCSRTS